MSNIISSNEWLNFMWVLHNKVRNGRGVKLTGLGALNEINNFLLLFFIERNFHKYEELDEKCKFSELYKTYCSIDVIADEKNKKIKRLDEYLPLYKQLWNHYCNPNNEKCVIRQMLSNYTIKSYLKNEVNSICAYTDNCETGKTIQDIIQYMYLHFEKISNKHISDMTLDDFGFDAFGNAYEKFKQQSCEDSGKTTGQHFTPVFIKEYIIENLNIKSTELFYEPACGTGGFIHTAMKYLKNKNENYKLFVENLVANECNAEIYKPLSINMLIHDIPIDNINKQDSLDITFGFNNKDTLTAKKYEGNTIYDYEIRDLSGSVTQYYVGLNACKLPVAVDMVKVDRTIDNLLTDLIENAIYVPSQITFKTAKLSSLDLIAMRAHQYDLFKVSDGTNTYYGNLISANLEDDVTEIKLLRRFKDQVIT